MRHYRHHYRLHAARGTASSPNMLGVYFLEDNIADVCLVIEIALVETAQLCEYISNVITEAKKTVKFNKVVFDATVDPVKDFVERASILSDVSVHFTVMSFLFVSEYNVPVTNLCNLRVVMFPIWFFSAQATNSNKEISKSNKTHAFSCLNRAPTYHRLLFYYYIKKENLLSKFIYSYYGKCPYTNRTPLEAGNYDLDLARIPNRELRDAAVECAGDFPLLTVDEPLAVNDHTTNHPAYNNAWCNIVTETNYYLPFTSEKIWKPIASKQLFLIVGPKGVHQYLESLGFYTFDTEGINLERHEKRILGTVYTVKQKADVIEQWYNENRNKIEHNYNLFNSNKLNQHLVDSALQQMQQ